MSEEQEVRKTPPETWPPKELEKGPSPKGVAAMQGEPMAEAKKKPSPAPLAQDVPNPSQKGSNFENWARQELFDGQARRITVLPEDNPKLDRLADGVGISKERRIADAYWKEDGSIWELKSGYQKGGIDQDQLYEYSLMEEAGYVNARVGGKKEKLLVTSVNYLFDSKAGAEANRSGAATFWYVDEKGKVQLLDS
jgi:hypothetical protein